MRLSDVPNCADHQCLIFDLWDSFKFGDEWVIFGQNYISINVWDVYVTNRATKQRWRGYRRWLCNQHSEKLYVDWRSMAWDEVTSVDRTNEYESTGEVLLDKVRRRNV